MKTTIIKRAALGAIAAAAVLAAGVAQAALQDRDLNGDSVTDAFYDTELNITWLRDANVNGPMNWATAAAWADSFSFAGYSDWRLPTTSFPHVGYYPDGSASEMGHLWYLELGNPALGPMANTGNFQNLQSGVYWSGTEYAPEPSIAWYFATLNGNQNGYPKSYDFLYAMAVRPGDVAAAVPEPQTHAMLLAGLGAIGWLARRRRA